MSRAVLPASKAATLALEATTLWDKTRSPEVHSHGMHNHTPVCRTFARSHFLFCCLLIYNAKNNIQTRVCNQWSQNLMLIVSEQMNRLSYCPSFLRACNAAWSQILRNLFCLLVLVLALVLALLTPWQCVAVCCSILQSFAVYLQCSAMCCSASLLTLLCSPSVPVVYLHFYLYHFSNSDIASVIEIRQI